MTTIGRQLIALKERSGVTLDQIAMVASYRGKSSVQKFFAPDYDPPFLDMAVAGRLARVFVGLGTPPIEEAEVFRLTGASTGPTRTYKYQQMGGLERDVGVYVCVSDRTITIAAGQPAITTYAIELDNPLWYAWHPPALENNRSIYCLMIKRTPLVPRYRPGELIFIDKLSPARLGDDVCIYLGDDITIGAGETESTKAAIAIFGTLEQHTNEHLHLRTIDGKTPFVIEHRKAKEVHRVFGITDALAG